MYEYRARARESARARELLHPSFPARNAQDHRLHVVVPRLAHAPRLGARARVPRARVLARHAPALARLGRGGRGRGRVAPDRARVVDLRGRARGHSQRGEYERRLCACLRDLDGEPAMVSDMLNKCFIFGEEDPGLDVAQLLAG